MAQHFRIYFLLAVGLLAWASPRAVADVTVPRFGVLMSQGQDVPGRPTLVGKLFSPVAWQRDSMVLDVGASYLRQYLHRRQLALEGTLQVFISGVECQVKESHGYGRTSYRITYSLMLAADLNGQEIWRGTVHRREVNLTGTTMISEGIRLLLVKEGVNELVGALASRSQKPSW